MSFDTEFDYSNAQTDISNRISYCNSVISQINSELAELAAIDPSLSGLTASKIQKLNAEKTRCEAQVTDLQGLDSNIGNITTLDISDKNSVYQFYSNSIQEPKNSWMIRMPYNISGIVSDANDINATGNLNGAQQMLLGNIICEKYPIVPISNIILPSLL